MDAEDGQVRRIPVLGICPFTSPTDDGPVVLENAKRILRGEVGNWAPSLISIYN